MPDPADRGAADLTASDRALLAEARTATLATLDAVGRPRLVPICYVVDDAGSVWSALDEKPKSTSDPRDLARARDVLARPSVAMLVHRWSEDWTELAWLRLDGTATLIESGAVPDPIITALRERYPQYRDHDLEHRPALRIEVARASRWSAGDGTT